MNSLKIFDETYSNKKNFIFLIFFELLNNAEFENLLPNEYSILLKKFNQNLQYKNFEKLDLNIILKEDNKSYFIKIFESIYSNRFSSLLGNINTALKSKIFLDKDLKQIGKILYEELDNKANETDFYNAIIHCLKFESFHVLSIVNQEDLIDDWISISETGQLRINYNMTNWSPIGSKIELKIEKFNDDFFKFICLAKAMDYDSREILLVEVHETNIKIQDGFFYHYHFESNIFLYKKPIYDFKNDTFKTEIDDYHFLFQRKNLPLSVH
ncbi:hypothetical protein [Flavobacterium sp. LAR06]|uniref:hypothetical protein n=1 Tax=Flavobacterium sp. LAR06 TaxID=3064897 RepID=UPI0035C15E65